MRKAQFLFLGTIGSSRYMKVAVGIGREEVVSNQFQDKEINAITQVNIGSSGDHNIVNRFKSICYVTRTEPAFYMSHLIKTS